MVTIDKVGDAVPASWSEVGAASARISRRLDRQGIGPGDVLVLSGATSFATLIAIFGAWRCGASITVVPPTGRRSPSVVAAEIESRVAALDAGAVFAEPSVMVEMHPRLPSMIVGLDPQLVRDEAASAIATMTPCAEGRRDQSSLFDQLSQDAVAIHQATSGTTGGQRLVPVTWGMLRQNVAAMADRLKLDERDSFVSWMPLFHDMGLVAYLVMPAMLGARCTLMPPDLFAASPTILPAAIQQRGGTFIGSPTSGLALVERALTQRESFNLSSLHQIVCGAEMIDIERCEGVVAAGRRHKLRPDVFTFAYGLAEATLAVSAKPRTAPADAQETAWPGSEGIGSGGWLRPAGVGFARTGPPLSGVEVRCVNVESRCPVPEGQVGEVEVRGGSVMQSYHGRTWADSGMDNERWFRTGDLAYTSAGELVIVGRIKDVVKVGGRTIVPEDVERIVGRLAGIRAGRVVAVPFIGRAGEALGVVAERRDRAAVDEQAVRVAVRRELDISPERVVFAPQGSVPKTTSGKLRRSAARAFLDDEAHASPKNSEELDRAH